MANIKLILYIQATGAWKAKKDFHKAVLLSALNKWGTPIVQDTVVQATYGNTLAVTYNLGSRRK